MSDLKSRIKTLEKKTAPKETDTSHLIIMAYDRDGVEYYKDSEGNEQRLDQLDQEKHHPLIVKFTRGEEA